jgi:hypothetical protein
MDMEDLRRDKSRQIINKSRHIEFWEVVPAIGTFE